VRSNLRGTEKIAVIVIARYLMALSWQRVMAIWIEVVEFESYLCDQSREDVG
jgi:hypothetical protein